MTYTLLPDCPASRPTGTHARIVYVQDAETMESWTGKKVEGFTAACRCGVIPGVTHDSEAEAAHALTYELPTACRKGWA